MDTRTPDNPMPGTIPRTPHNPATAHEAPAHRTPSASRGPYGRLLTGETADAVADRMTRREREAGFLSRVMRTTLAASVFVAWCLLALERGREAASFSTGAALGLSMLWSTRYAVTQALTRAEYTPRRRKWLAVALAAGKYGIAGVLIWKLTRWPYAHLPAFVAGAAMTQAILFLKALGLVLCGHRTPVPLRDILRPDREGKRDLTRVRQYR